MGIIEARGCKKCPCFIYKTCDQCPEFGYYTKDCSIKGKWEGICTANDCVRAQKEAEEEKPIIINIPAVETWPLKDLLFACKKHHVKGYTKMNRVQLIDQVEKLLKGAE